MKVTLLVCARTYTKLFQSSFKNGELSRELLIFMEDKSISGTSHDSHMLPPVSKVAFGFEYQLLRCTSESSLPTSFAYGMFQEAKGKKLETKYWIRWNFGLIQQSSSFLKKIHFFCNISHYVVNVKQASDSAMATQLELA